jgi:hypothetical protein
MRAKKEKEKKQGRGKGARKAAGEEDKAARERMKRGEGGGMIKGRGKKCEGMGRAGGGKGW